MKARMIQQINTRPDFIYFYSCLFVIICLLKSIFFLENSFLEKKF